MPKRWMTTTLTAAVVAMMGCYDADPEPEMEGGPMEGDEARTEAPATDTRAVGFGEWDADQSDDLVRDEWDAWWADNDIRSRWDMDDAEGLSEEEWGEATHDLWDVDEDDVVDEAEWTAATERWYGADVDYGTWADWDGDGDSELDLNEVREGMEREGLYDRTDRDNDLLIDDEELADWFFDVFDADQDAAVDATEWDRGADYDFDA